MNDPGTQLPCQGRWQRAPQKRFAETVVYVHHFGGHRSSVKAHQDFVSELGFDSVTFNLTMKPVGPLAQLPGLKFWQPGLRARWVKEITSVLNAVPGRKIVHSFSFPSSAVASALAQRKAKQDVSAWICEGGPFFRLLECFWNYYAQVEKVSFLPMRALRIALAMGNTDLLHYEKDLKTALAGLPPQFPILNIRSWQDPLVPISAIDAALSGLQHLKLETLTLPEAGHIDGLFKSPQDYKPRVAKFLTTYASTEPLRDRHPLESGNQN